MKTNITRNEKGNIEIKIEVTAELISEAGRSKNTINMTYDSAKIIDNDGNELGNVAGIIGGAGLSIHIKNPCESWRIHSLPIIQQIYEKYYNKKD